MGPLAARLASIIVALVIGLTLVAGQGTAPPQPLQLLTSDGRVPIPTSYVGTEELIALDDIATLLKVVIRDDALTGGVRVTYRDRAVVASAGQPTVSVNGRIVALPSPVVRTNGRWLVPFEFLPRGLGQIYDRRIDLRRQARLVVVGDLRVPRVTVRLESTGVPTRAVVEIVPAATVALGTGDGQLHLRLDADAVDLAPTTGGGLIESVRAVDRQPVVTFTVASTAATPRVTTTTTPDRTRVLVEVAAAPAMATSTPEPVATSSAPPVPRASATPDSTAGVARTGITTVVIDPGHGGDDHGVRSAGGLEEKQLTLDIARRLRSLLEARLGVRVVLTRDEDRSVGPDERTARANAARGDVLISLHANGAFSSSASGASVLVPLTATPDALPTTDQDVDSVVLPALGGSSRTVEFVRWDRAQSRHGERAWAFAGALAEELDAVASMQEQPVRRVPLRALAGANMPAVHVEVGYLTNPDEVRMFGTDEFKSGIAQSVFDAIARFATSSITGP